MSSSKNPVRIDQRTTTKLWTEDIRACASSQGHLPWGISPTCICSSDDLCEVSISHWIGIPARARTGNTGPTLDSSTTSTSTFSFRFRTTSKCHRNLKGFKISSVYLDSPLHFTCKRAKIFAGFIIEFRSWSWLTRMCCCFRGQWPIVRTY